MDIEPHLYLAIAVFIATTILAVEYSNISSKTECFKLYRCHIIKKCLILFIPLWLISFAIFIFLIMGSGYPQNVLYIFSYSVLSVGIVEGISIIGVFNINIIKAIVDQWRNPIINQINRERFLIHREQALKIADKYTFRVIVRELRLLLGDKFNDFEKNRKNWSISDKRESYAMKIVKINPEVARKLVSEVDFSLST